MLTTFTALLPLVFYYHILLQFLLSGLYSGTHNSYSGGGVPQINLVLGLLEAIGSLRALLCQSDTSRPGARRWVQVLPLRHPSVREMCLI